MYKRGDVVKLIKLNNYMSDLTLNSTYEVAEDEDAGEWVALTDNVQDINYVSPEYLSIVSKICDKNGFSLCEEYKFSINMSISKSGDDDPFLHFDHLSMTKQQMINTINQMWESV